MATYKSIYHHQHERCFYCLLRYRFLDMEKEHVYPYSKGGRGIQNKVLSCKDCNQIKADLLIPEFIQLVKTKLKNYLHKDNIKGMDFDDLQLMSQRKITRYKNIIRTCQRLVSENTIREGWHETSAYKFVDCNTAPIRLN